jgi:hypothetical protein
MGVELEGSWDASFRDLATLHEGAQGKGDNSVSGLPGNMGEITTKPHTSLDALIKDVVEMYPNHVNDTAGLHVHASFTPMDTTALTTKEFWAYFTRRWEAWGEAHKETMTRNERDWFFSRLRATTAKAKKYCKAEFKPQEQFEFQEDRYTQINFTAYKKYKTVEVRVLPMFESKELAALAIRELSDIYNTFLSDYTFPPVKMESSIKGENDEILDKTEMTAANYGFLEEEWSQPSPNLVTGDDIYYHYDNVDAMFMAPFGKKAVHEP